MGHIFLSVEQLIHSQKSKPIWHSFYRLNAIWGQKRPHSAVNASVLLCYSKVKYIMEMNNGVDCHKTLD